ncbi:Spy/CpxP family protein refolding chaperone [Halomonas fontilapidosi]|uniref:Spy/CpxP family protein refolding chaperone n=1 Tax=Halomonas fontilapidosi TaxID=616675 RepID=A0A7W5DI51_9GAMM|nr:Spy/CpxP family protein refolding chaperone [Halomonas fontilapidosi]MBB3183356.1 Spy/CpxP family protein refolding chaperone [Halomonas fontilapidosi]
MNLRTRSQAIALALMLGAAASGTALAQGMMGQGYGQMGPGMMGPGFGQGYGHMGPGMMGPGFGQGYGHMGPGMMGPGFGQGYGHMGPGMMRPGFGQGYGYMGLQQLFDEEQRNAARELMQEHRPAQFERMNRIMELREEMFSLMQQERPDPDEVKALHARMADVHGEMMAEQLRLRNQLQDLLTDEQRQRLRDAMPYNR